MGPRRPNFAVVRLLHCVPVEQQPFALSAHPACPVACAAEVAMSETDEAYADVSFACSERRRAITSTNRPADRRW